MIPILALLRILLGVFFFLVGGSKLLAPYQNFLYVVQSYEVFSSPFDEIVARTAPWLEFLLGVFLILGLWVRNSLIVLLAVLAIFIGILEQAIIRGLPIDSCGCFGDMILVPIRKMVLFDGTLFLLAVYQLIRLKETARLSLDNYFLVK